MLIKMNDGEDITIQAKTNPNKSITIICRAGFIGAREFEKLNTVSMPKSVYNFLTEDIATSGRAEKGTRTPPLWLQGSPEASGGSSQSESQPDEKTKVKP